MNFFFLKGNKLLVLESVYPPSEDSFLLAEAIEAEKGCSVLDMGTGSGIQGINAALLGAKTIVCTDLNKEALKNAEENAKSLGLKGFEFRQGNLFEAAKGEKFDLIIFNPPYVPSEEKKFEDLDGGKGGREVLDLFLEGFEKHLEKGGKCFFLQSSLNGEEETIQKLEEKKFEIEEKARKRIFFEELVVFKTWKKGLK